jgi:hypothetical protein
MALYIEVRKTEETADFATYLYEFRLSTGVVRNSAGKLRGCSKLVNGKIKIFKETGEVEVLKMAEGDQGNYLERAKSVILKARSKGMFPNQACWAS